MHVNILHSLESIDLYNNKKKYRITVVEDEIDVVIVTMIIIIYSFINLKLIIIFLPFLKLTRRKEKLNPHITRTKEVFLLD